MILLYPKESDIVWRIWTEKHLQVMCPRVQVHYQEILKRHVVEQASEFKKEPASPAMRQGTVSRFHAIQGFPQSRYGSPGIVAVGALAEEPEPVAEVAVTGGESHGD